jgi:hypothetical protein
MHEAFGVTQCDGRRSAVVAFEQLLLEVEEMRDLAKTLCIARVVDDRGELVVQMGRDGDDLLALVMRVRVHDALEVVQRRRRGLPDLTGCLARAG